MRLTLRTLLAYLDDTLPADEAKLIGQKVSESETAQQLVETINRVTRRRALSTPSTEGKSATDPNTVAEYLSDALSAEQIADFENICLESDVHLAEVAACHQILTLLLSEPVRVPPSARQRMYRLVTGPEALPNKKPSNTLPIGGILPDETLPSSDDSDAGYLLGMKAYGETSSRGQRLAQLGLLAGLLGGLGLTVYAAWPHAQRPETAQSAPAFVPPKKLADDVREKPPQFQPPENPMADAVNPNEVAEPMVVAKPVENPNPPPAVEAVPPEKLPRMDSIKIGTLTTPEKVLLVERNGKWSRVGAAVPAIASAERMTSLPGYQSELKLDTGAEITLWGHLPEPSSTLPVREASITTYLPEDGFATDLMLHTGRVYLTATKPSLQKLRIRTSNDIWDVALGDAGTEIVVEATHRIAGGLKQDGDGKPTTQVTIGVLKGRARLSIQNRTVPELLANDYLVLTGPEKQLVGPKKIGVAPGLESTYFARSPAAPSDPTWARAAHQLLADFAEGLQTTESVRVRFDEFLADAPPPPDESKLEMFKRTLRGSYGIYGHAATGQLTRVVDGLKDEGRARVRDAAIDALVSHPALVQEQRAAIVSQFTEKHRLTEEQARSVLSHLRGPSLAERTTPEVLDQLGESLSSPVLHIRELAFWHLMNTVDPEAKQMKPLIVYDAAATAEARDGPTKAWKRRIEELKKLSMK